MKTTRKIDNLTSSLNQFDKIKNSAKFFKVLNFKKVMSTDFQEVYIKNYFSKNFNIGILRNLKNLIKTIFQTNKFDNLLLNEFDKKQVFFFQDNHRKDKQKLLNGMVKNLQADYGLIDIKKLCGVPLFYTDTISNIGTKIAVAFYFLKIFKLDVKSPIRSKVYLLVKLLQYINFYNFFKQTKFPRNVSFIFFNDYMPIQNIICQIANNNNNTTFGCQHAIYHFERTPYPRMFDALAYSISAKYILCWGESTANSYVTKLNIDKDRILVACHPLRGEHYANKQFLESTKYTTIIVLLSQKKYFNQNLALVKLIKKISIKNKIFYKIKLHPSDNIKKYLNIIKGDSLLLEIVNQEKLIIEMADKYSVCVFYKTSGFMELLSQAVPCLKYISGDENIFNLNTFESVKDLEKSINDIKKDKKNWYKNDVKPLIDYVYGNYTGDPSKIYEQLIINNK
jgi:hypothetical protein